MRLFVETNFIVELVKRQPQAQVCEQILRGAAEGKIDLFIPVFSLMEPIYTVEGDIKQRDGLARLVNGEIDSANREGDETRELRRVAKDFDTLMEERNLRYKNDLLNVNLRLTQVAQLIPVGHVVWIKAQELYQTKSLRLPDAIIATSIYVSCQEQSFSSEMCFVTQVNDFRNPTVRQLLERTGYSCLYDYNAAAGRARLT